MDTGKPAARRNEMTITEIKKVQPSWSDVTVAEAWLKDMAREIGADAVWAEMGFAADANGEYTLSDEEAAKIIAENA